jgi:anoctamin-8
LSVELAPRDPAIEKLRLALEKGTEVRQHFPRKLAELTMLSSPDYLWTMVCMPSTVAASVRDRGAQRWDFGLYFRTKRAEISNLVRVQAAGEVNNGFFGTPSLRLSGDIHNPARTFSLIFGESSRSRNWMSLSNSESAIDIECFSDEQYELLFDGFTNLLRQYSEQGSMSYTPAPSIYGARGTKASQATDLRRNNSAGFRTLFAGNNRRSVGGLRAATNKSKSQAKEMPESEQFLGWKTAGTQIYARLQQAGLRVKKVWYHDRKRLILKLKLPNDKLEELAETHRYHVRQKDGTWVRFRRKIRDQMLDTNQPWGQHTIFRSSERQQMIDWVIRSRIQDGGAGLGDSTQLGRQIVDRVPLHMTLRLSELRAAWITYWRIPEQDTGHWTWAGTLASLERLRCGALTQPLDVVAGYFGETVALYFAGLECYARWLMMPSVLGIFVFAVQVYTRRIDHPVCCFYGAFISGWSAMLLVRWRRRASELTYRWGVLDFEAEESTRPQFRGNRKRDPYTGEWVTNINWAARFCAYAISVFIVSFAVLAMLFLVGGLYAARDHAISSMDGDADNLAEDADTGGHHKKDRYWWFTMMFYPALYGLLVPIFFLCFKAIALSLNDFENHVTNSQYRNNLIWKVFSFKFVVVFSSLFYYAFSATPADASNDKQAEKLAEEAFLRVGATLFCFVTVSQWWQKFILQVGFPLLRHKWNRYWMQNALKKETARIRHMARTVRDQHIRKLQKKYLEQAGSRVWEEAALKKYATYDDYTILLVQFGYVACFSMVFPLAPLLSLGNTLVQIRMDAFKLCQTRQRPIAEKSGSIGIWENVLQLMIVVAVITNCAMIGLTSVQLRKTLPMLTPSGRVLVVVIAEHFLLFVGYMVQSLFPRIPPSVQRALARDRVSQQNSRRRHSGEKTEKEGTGEQAANSDDELLPSGETIDEDEEFDNADDDDDEDEESVVGALGRRTSNVHALGRRTSNVNFGARRTSNVNSGARRTSNVNYGRSYDATDEIYGSDEDDDDIDPSVLGLDSPPRPARRSSWLLSPMAQLRRRLTSD